MVSKERYSICYQGRVEVRLVRERVIEMRELRGLLADLEKHFTVEQQELVMELIAEIRKLTREGKWKEIEPVRKLVMEQLH